MDTHRSFVRALNAHHGGERQRLVDREGERLDRLEEGIRNREAEDPPKVERRLRGMTKLREAIGQ
jgi:hypothetical protein